MNPRLAGLVDRLPSLAPCAPAIEAGFALLRDCFAGGGKLLLCGNGGSAADAEHWAVELLKGFLERRPLPDEARQRLPADLAEHLQRALPAIPLTGFLSLSTAFANDVRPDMVFAQLVWALGRPGDALVALSTSGGSENVCRAAEAAAAGEMRVLSLTGADGGRLAGLSDVCIRAPAAETHLSQEYHLPIYHCLCLMLEDEFFSQP